MKQAHKFLHQVTSINPATAQRILSTSPGNRTLSRASVESYARDMRAGNWKLTHQGILLGKGGMLIDGHHRLTALVAANVTLPFVVVTDPTLTSPLDLPIDRGNTRSVAYTLGKSNALIATAGFLFDKVLAMNKATVSEMDRVTAEIEPLYNAMTASSSTAKHITCAPYYAAGVVSIASGVPAAYVHKVHHTLVNATMHEFTPVMSSYYKQMVVDRVAMTQLETFTRALKMFDPKFSQSSKLAFKDVSGAIAAAKAKAVASLKSLQAVSK